MANINQAFKQAHRETSVKNIAVVLALVTLVPFGTAFAGDADSARWDQESRLATPLPLPHEGEDSINPAIKRRFQTCGTPYKNPPSQFATDPFGRRTGTCSNIRFKLEASVMSHRYVG